MCLASHSFAVAIPRSLLGFNFFLGKDAPLGIADAILLSILIGYVLDSIKGYRWTPALATYNRKKKELARSLASLVGREGGSANPDYYIAVLWRQDEATYNRIFIERAEWVMILETSFSLLVGCVILLATTVYIILTGRPVRPVDLVVIPVLFTASCLAARNGIERMTAHDLKLLEAMRAIVAKKEESDA